VKSVLGDLPVFLDSGTRSGLDIVRALAMGAHSVFAGRPFLYAVGALGAKGGAHLLSLMIEETGMTMGQIGVSDIKSVATADLFATVPA